MKFVGSATVSSRGQIVIPKKVREILDIQEGDDIIFAKDAEGYIYISKEILIIIPPKDKD